MCTDGAGRRGHSSRGNSVDKGLERETVESAAVRGSGGG